MLFEMVVKYGGISSSSSIGMYEERERYAIFSTRKDCADSAPQLIIYLLTNGTWNPETNALACSCAPTPVAFVTKCICIPYIFGY